MQLTSIPNGYCQPPRVSLRFAGSKPFVNNQNGGTRDNKGDIKIAPKNKSRAPMTSNGRFLSHLDVMPLCCAALRQTPSDEIWTVTRGRPPSECVVRGRCECRQGSLRVSGVPSTTTCCQVVMYRRFFDCIVYGRQVSAFLQVLHIHLMSSNRFIQVEIIIT